MMTIIDDDENDWLSDHDIAYTDFLRIYNVLDHFWESIHYY
jgi:hypothetical protein